MKAYIGAFAIFTLTFYPSVTNASFLSGMVTKVLGKEVDAQSQNDTKIEDKDEVTHNSQTLPLQETSINPDFKSIKDIKPVTAFEDEALVTNNNLIDTDSELDKYASSAKINVYVVKSGDTLDAIARKFKTSKVAILASNSELKQANKLKVGQKLVILSADNQITEKVTEKKESPIAKEKTPITPKKERVIEKPELIKVIKEEQAPETKVAQVAEEDTTDPQDTKEESTPTQNSSNYIWPFPSGVGRISQGIHADQAYDFAAPKGTPIYAPYDGEVLIAKASGYNGGYGLYVVINFTDGRQAILGHMSKVVSESGDIVKQGDIIGYVGSTGKSTGPHVHIGFRGTMGNPYKGLKVNSNSIEDHD